MANIFLVSHILLLFHLPKGSWNKSAKYEKLREYWSYSTRNRDDNDDDDDDGELFLWYGWLTKGV